MTKEQLDSLREGWDFEAKLAAGRHGEGVVPESFWESYSAMANTKGGFILLGAKERRDGTIDFRGITNISKVERELWDLLSNRQKVSSNILRREDVEEIQVGEAKLLLIHVPKASRSDRPLYINGSWEKGTFLRVHEGDRTAYTEVARRMLADAIPNRDSGIVDEFTLEDIEPSTLRRYREFMGARRPDHVFLQHDDEAFLISIGAAHREQVGDKQIRPTWAGLWMLGKETSIRQACPHWHLSYMELPDEQESIQRWLDRVHPDGMWNANIFEFYIRVIGKLHDGLKVPFQLEKGHYRKDETQVHEAVREAFVNALVHADYQGTTGVKVRKRRSGFEFINPGLLLVTVEQLWRGGVSEPRNPQLHRMFGLLSLGEREGSGGPAMREVWRGQHWRAPHIWEDTENLETHLRMPLESLLPAEAVEELDSRFGGRFRNLDELGRVILCTAQVEGKTHHGRITELSDAHSRDITLKLQELVRANLLEPHGSAKGREYSVATAPVLPLFPTRVASSDSNVASSDSNVASSDSNVASSDSNVASSDSNVASSDSNVASSDSNVASSDSNVASSDVLERIRRSGRAPREDVEAAIVEACRDRFLTVSEISELIDRANSTIRIHFLPSLVRDGRLEMRYPDTPTHHDQAYRAARSHFSS